MVRLLFVKSDLDGLSFPEDFLLPSPSVANAAAVDPVIKRITTNFLPRNFNNMERLVFNFLTNVHLIEEN